MFASLTGYICYFENVINAQLDVKKNKTNQLIFQGKEGQCQKAMDIS